jgi:hypothetical protein
MSRSSTTASEKLRTSKPPVMKRLDKAFAGMPEGCLMLIASPAIVDAYVRGIPRGRFVDPKVMRADLADAHQAEHTCPVSTGIFLRIVADAAWERHQTGVPIKEITPFWRVIAPDSLLATKLACGSDFLRKRRTTEQEGRD